MNELSQILGAFQQIAYWRKETKRLALHIQREAQTMPDGFLRQMAPEVAKVYQEIAKRASAILAPLPKMFRAQLTHHWQQELDSTLFPDIPKLGEPSSEPHSGAVLTDSVQGNQMKLDLIRAAEQSIVMSGCYLGGRVFDTMLDLMAAKLRSTPELNILLTGSEHMIQPSNWDRIKAMRTEFNARFQGVFTPEAFAKDNPLTETFGFSCNHVKALVIDGGKYFLIGGSGLEDRWASLKGDLPPLLPLQNQLSGLRPGEPLSFRDMDFVFNSPQKNSIGERLHLSIAQLISRLSSLDERLEMVHAFAPQGFTLPERSDETRLPLKGLHEDLRMTAFLTGPEAAGNTFEDTLIDQIDKAEDSIVIAHMYFIPSPRMLQQLINAHNRGVRIVVIANKDKERTPLTHELFVARGRLSFLKLLQWTPKPNIELYEYDVAHTTYHKKVFVIDGKIIATGSSNIGYKSMQGIVDWEDNLIIESENYAIDILEVLERDMELSRRVPHEELLEMGMDQLIKAHLQGGVEYFL
jgi:phosphatidylserine/phosphatidylglycerophosphate/cardiolipin synthase-like enzyme